jgi:hypothetical protein
MEDLGNVFSMAIFWTLEMQISECNCCFILQWNLVYSDVYLCVVCVFIVSSAFKFFHKHGRGLLDVIIYFEGLSLYKISGRKLPNLTYLSILLLFLSPILPPSTSS